jgi:hypothetical protein
VTQQQVSLSSRSLSASEVIAGRLAKFLPFWEQLTQDQWVLEVIRGMRVDLVRSPQQPEPPKQLNFSQSESVAIDNSVSDLLAKAAIARCSHEADEFISRVFLVPKKSGDLRPVINLRGLNKFVRYEHFKLETLNSIRFLINEGDYGAAFDLKDAYFMINLHQRDRKFFRFEWRQQLFEFACMCFGLSSAPRIFTKVTKPLLCWLRERSIRVSSYIDDFLILNSSFESCAGDLKICSDLLQQAGFLCNSKSVLIPSQRFVFLGVVVDTVSMKFFLTSEKQQKILSLIDKILSRSIHALHVPVQRVASLIGMLNFAADYAVPAGRLFLRSLEADKVQAVQQNGGYRGLMSLSRQSYDDLHTWQSSQLLYQGARIRATSPQAVLQCDASLAG